MQAAFTLRTQLNSPEATSAFAARLAPKLAAGDTLLLSGDLGAGKSHFARALIRARLGDPHADVPSPSFTLVQTYDAGDIEIWHADLYRLSSADEVLELGLESALDTGICLIEWPDRLGSDVPRQALDLHFEVAGAGKRILTVTGTDARRCIVDTALGTLDA